MSFVRQPLLEKEVEEQLKDELSELWLAGKKGREIAQELNFSEPTIQVNGKEVKNPYAKVRPEYVYYYRQKFAKESPELFPIRRKPSFAQGEQRYKVAPEELDIIEPEEFIETLNEKLPYDSFYARRARSFLIVLFYTPLRSSEVYERTISDFKITKSKIIINLLRKKKNHKPTDKKEPAEIDRVLPLVDELVEYLQAKEWKKEIKKKGKVVKDEETGEVLLNQRPWKISHDTARDYVRQLYPDGYCHWFRFNWITKRLAVFPSLSTRNGIPLSFIDVDPL